MLRSFMTNLNWTSLNVYRERCLEQVAMTEGRMDWELVAADQCRRADLGSVKPGHGWGPRGWMVDDIVSFALYVVSSV